MRQVKPVTHYAGIGEVTLGAKPVAKVSYEVRCRRTVETARAGEERAEWAAVQALIDGDIRVLSSEASLYTDELYTLHLGGKHRRECDFYTQPIDVVAGIYRLEGQGDFRELSRRH